jgi:hypothetical protein
MALVESQGPKVIWETREMLVALAMKCLTMIRFDQEDDIRGVKFKKNISKFEVVKKYQ